MKGTTELYMHAKETISWPNLDWEIKFSHGTKMASLQYWEADQEITRYIY